MLFGKGYSLFVDRCILVMGTGKLFQITDLMGEVTGDEGVIADFGF
jgi:hypothetical protein